MALFSGTQAGKIAVTHAFEVTTLAPGEHAASARQLATSVSWPAM
jgi:hypothetical protein